MPEKDQVGAVSEGNFYGPQYARIDSQLAAEIRREAFGEDIGQESWRSAAEQAEIAHLLRLTSNSRVLDVACGAGGPSLALVQQFGCFLTGVDIEPEGVSHGNAEAKKRGLAERASFCCPRLRWELAVRGQQL
jgi:SAM-dependent methyltransferase